MQAAVMQGCRKQRAGGQEQSPPDFWQIRSKTFSFKRPFDLLPARPTQIFKPSYFPIWYVINRTTIWLNLVSIVEIKKKLRRAYCLAHFEQFSALISLF